MSEVRLTETKPLRDLAARIDQTLLKPDVGNAAFRAWVERNASFGFATLCVPPARVPLSAELLASTNTKVCTVVGFPLGYALGVSKATEAAQCVEAGAVEVDMVIDIGALMEGDYTAVERDIADVVKATAEASGGSALVKVILETGYLSEPQVANGSEICVAAGADYVKTSTGFGPRGASVEDVAIMRASVGPEFGVKAAGGIRDLPTALEMLAAGASRLGTSAGIEILEQAAAGDA